VIRVLSTSRNTRTASCTSILVDGYRRILKDGVVFKDLGADYYNQFNKERKINAYLKKLKALGWEAPVVAA
ncbi:IS110 family transposase, partial [Clostridiaceae bacterium]|nr:IS110 family transposase [Clostridiaceae bacterium]